VPVGFHEISNAAVLVEMAYESASLMPELSFGTHFFQDLVETDIFYVALFPDKGNAVLNRENLLRMDNVLTKLLPDAARYESIVHVCQTEHTGLQIVGDMLAQQVVCYFE
jgi:hypothetical protein